MSMAPIHFMRFGRVKNMTKSSSRAVIGIDIGGTKIAAGIVSATGEVTQVLRAHTPSEQGADAILTSCIELAIQLRTTANAQGIEIVAVGVGAGGQIDVTTGRVHYATAVIPGWSGAEIVRTLEQALSLPARADNDVNVLALAEHRFGAAKPYRNVLFVAVGTGIGGALILDNQLSHGASYSAGEIAHLLVDYRGERICNCGLPGHLEGYTCGPAIAQRYSILANLVAPCTLQEVAQRAAQGDRLALAAIEEGARILGKALMGVLSLLDPQALVIGGGVTNLGDGWWQPLLAEIRANPLPSVAQLPVLKAALKQHSAVVGAGALVMGYL